MIFVRKSTMADYNVYLSEPAEYDLRDIIQSISTQFAAPITAANMMDCFENALKSLSEMPYRCPSVKDERLASMGYHKLMVKNFIIFFTFNSKNKIVDVERILYARRDWLSFL